MLKLIFNGHIGKDCEVKKFDNGSTVINFNVAHSTRYKDRQGTPVTKTVWIKCAYWTDKTAIAQYLKRGTQVLVEGEPEVEWYNSGGQDGIVASQKCRVVKVELLGSGKSEGSPKEAGESTGKAGTGKHGAYDSNLPNPSDISEPIDDLPF